MGPPMGITSPVRVFFMKIANIQFLIIYSRKEYYIPNKSLRLDIARPSCNNVLKKVNISWKGAPPTLSTPTRQAE